LIVDYSLTPRAADGAAPLGNRGGEKAGLSSVAVVLDKHAPPLTPLLGCKSPEGDMSGVLCWHCKHKMRVPGSALIECAWRRGSTEHVWFFEGFDPNYPKPVLECEGYEFGEGWQEESSPTLASPDAANAAQVS